MAIILYIQSDWEQAMHGFNPLVGLSIMLVVFWGVDYLLLGSRFTRKILGAIGGMF